MLRTTAMALAALLLVPCPGAARTNWALARMAAQNALGVAVVSVGAKTWPGFGRHDWSPALRRAGSRRILVVEVLRAGRGIVRLLLSGNSSFSRHSTILDAALGHRWATEVPLARIALPALALLWRQCVPGPRGRAAVRPRQFELGWQDR